VALQATIRLPGPLRAVAPLVAPGEQASAERVAMEAELEQRLAAAQQQLQAERKKLAGAMAAIQDAAGQLRQLHADILAEGERQLADLAVQIARKVLMQEIQAGRYEIDPIVAEALRHVPARHEAVVHLHPDDHAACQMVGQLAGEAEGIRFVADPNVPRAECAIETPEGVVEAAIESHLSQIARALGDEE